MTALWFESLSQRPWSRQACRNLDFLLYALDLWCKYSHVCARFARLSMSYFLSASVIFCRYASSWMTYWWGYELVHKWMLTGKFTWDVPILGRWLEWQYPEGKPPCDWFGVNYYSR